MKSGKPPAQRNQAKDAISALCRILSANDGISRLAPESFRQAKFDQKEGIKPLWTLLKQLVHLIFSGVQGVDKADVDEDSVKTCLHRWGYICPAFHCGECGSRELLLAVGWLLAKSKFIAEEVRAQLLLTSPPVLVPHLQRDGLELHGMLGEMNGSLPTKGAEGNSEVKTPLGEARRLVWMVGRLRLAVKSLHWAQQALCTSLHRVHEATLGVSIRPPLPSHLTAWEAHLLRHPKQMNKYLGQLEKESLILQACLAWRHLEPVFWQWMVSVQKAKEAAREEDPSLTQCSPLSHPDLCQEGPPTMASELAELQASLLEQLCGLETELKAVWSREDVLDQITDHPDVSKRKAEIENSVIATLSKSRDEIHTVGSKDFPLHAVQFAYKLAERRQPESAPENAVDIQSEILRLTAGVQRMKEELDEMRSRQQDRLSGFAKCLTNVVCIPPMSEKSNYALDT